MLKGDAVATTGWCENNTLVTGACEIELGNIVVGESAKSVNVLLLGVCHVFKNKFVKILPQTKVVKLVSNHDEGGPNILHPMFTIQTLPSFILFESAL